jgi:hypothetical protein
MGEDMLFHVAKEGGADLAVAIREAIQSIGAANPPPVIGVDNTFVSLSIGTAIAIIAAIAVGIWASASFLGKLKAEMASGFAALRLFISENLVSKSDCAESRRVCEDAASEHREEARRAWQSLHDLEMKVAGILVPAPWDGTERRGLGRKTEQEEGSQL